MAIQLIAPPTRVQGSFPLATVTVYLATTTTLATIFSDNLGTALGNPFTAQADGTWQFWAANGLYDVQFSGGGIPTPFTIYALGDGGISQLLGPAYINVCDFPGPGVANQIIQAEAALPVSGGTIDCRCLTGTQALTADPFTGMTKPTNLIFGGVTFIVSVSLTLPNNINLTLLPGATFSMNAGLTMDIQCAMDGSSITPHFAGAGVVQLITSNLIPWVFPQWWGFTTAASGAAVASAFRAAEGFHPVRLPHGIYTITSSLVFGSG